MTKVIRIAAVMGIGVALAPFMVIAQAPAPAEHTATGQLTPSAIPVEDQATKEQLARLFQVMRLTQQMDSMKASMSAMMQQQIRTSIQDVAEKRNSSLTADQKAAVSGLIGKYMDKAMNIYPMDEMLEDMTAVYQRHVSRSDVEAFIAFYNSTPGQHLLDQQPAIMKEYTPVVMQRIQGRSKELQGQMMRELEELTKTSPQPDKPAQK